jgi:hypothetical protein
MIAECEVWKDTSPVMGYLEDTQLSAHFSQVIMARMYMYVHTSSHVNVWEVSKTTGAHFSQLLVTRMNFLLCMYTYMNK